MSAQVFLGATYHAMTDAEALALVADLLAMVAARCNLETVTCPKCGANKRCDWDSAQLHRKLLGMSESVRGIATKVAGGGVAHPPPRKGSLC